MVYDIEYALLVFCLYKRDIFSWDQTPSRRATVKSHPEVTSWSSIMTI